MNFKYMVTAEEFTRNLNKLGKNDFNPPSEYDKTLWDTEVINTMIEFARMHVQAALDAASEKATMDLRYPSPYEDANEKGLSYAIAEEVSRGGEYGSVEIDKDSILNAYPLNNVK